MMQSGVINIDKPTGWTSHDVVAKVRSLLRKNGIKRVGHTGTLDPMATGVLPICFGVATKISSYLMEGEKEYDVTCRLGVETDTGDITGTVLHTCDPPAFSREQLTEALSAFTGTFMQTPPIYSAIKVNGVPMYQAARKGFAVEITPREVTIRSLQFKQVEGALLFLNVVCSKGTYIRSLCADIGRKLGVYGCADSLRRLRSGPFVIDQAIGLEKFITRCTLGEWEDSVCSLEKVLTYLQNTRIEEKTLAKIKNEIALASKEEVHLC